ncbi:MAG: PHP domain-containing protein [Nitrospinota bacterium]|nr:PHP domain-containing protein [Nitrospinota bacterium]
MKYSSRNDLESLSMYSENLLAVDFHVHSNASDGQLQPKEVVKYAKEKNIVALSLTDHDTVAGLQEARVEASKNDIFLFDGIEVSASYDGKIFHLLGHFIDPDSIEIKSLVERHGLSRKTRMSEMIDRLINLGIAVDKDEFNNIFGNVSSITRGQLCNYLLEKALVSSTEEVFNKYIGDGCPAYVELDCISPEKAIETIVQSGGVATLAHPNLTESDDFIGKLVDAGLSGIETDHPSQSKLDSTHYKKIAEYYSLLQMGGSDCHGDRLKGLKIGSHLQRIGLIYELSDRCH